jgi:hypothetical protein
MGQDSHRAISAAGGRARWRGVPAEERSRVLARAGRRGGRARWRRMTEAQRAAQVAKMRKGRRRDVSEE